MRLHQEVIESARIAWDALRANKLRSGLATLGVVIGIVTVTLMGTAINGVNQAFRQSISSLGADVLFVGRFPWMAFDDWRLYRNRREISPSARNPRKATSPPNAAATSPLTANMLSSKAEPSWIAVDTSSRKDLPSSRMRRPSVAYRAASILCAMPNVMSRTSAVG